MTHPSEFIADFLCTEAQKIYGPKYVGSRIGTISTTLPLTPALIFLNSHTLRRVSIRVNRSLLAWSEGRYSLEFTTRVPTPLEILEIQTQGRRIISLPAQTVGKKTPFEFVIHDLEHADRFFFDPDLHRQQVDFFVWILERTQKNIYTPYFSNPVFKEKFEYLISDMNSHPAHMHQYLNHIVNEATKFSRDQNEARRDS